MKQTATEGKRYHIESIAVFLIIIDIFLVNFPLFGTSLYQHDGHDTIFHLFRIEGLAQGLRDGEFPVRIQTSQLNGYGYPVSIMYGDFFLYLPAILTIIGFSAISSYKFFVFIVNSITIILTYLLTRRITKSNKLSVLTATLWGLAPYRIEDIYLRGAVGEYLALLFLPLIAYGLYLILVKPSSKESRSAWISLSLGMTGVIVSHIISILLFSIAALPIVICGLISRDWLLKCRLLVRSIMASFLSSLFFIIPFIDYYKNADLQITHILPNYQRAVISDYSVEPFQLFTLFQPMSGVSTKQTSGIIGEMPYSIGWSLTMGVIIWIAYLIFTHRRPTRMELSCFVSSCILIFMMAPGFLNFWSKNLGKTLNSIILMLSSIQYSWRLLGPVSFLFVILCLCGVSRVYYSIDIPKHHEISTILSVLILCLCFLEAGVAVTTSVETSQPLNSFSNVADKTQIYGIMGGEYLPYNTDSNKLFLSNSPRASKGINLGHFSKTGTSISINVKSKELGGTVKLPLLFYPHYKAEGLRSIYHISKGENNLIEISIPPHTDDRILVSFIQPKIWVLSYWISIMTTIILCFLLFHRFVIHSLGTVPRSAGLDLDDNPRSNRKVIMPTQAEDCHDSEK